MERVSGRENAHWGHLTAVAYRSRCRFEPSGVTVLANGTRHRANLRETDAEEPRGYQDARYGDSDRESELLPLLARAELQALLGECLAPRPLPSEASSSWRCAT